MRGREQSVLAFLVTWDEEKQSQSGCQGDRPRTVRMRRRCLHLQSSRSKWTLEFFLMVMEWDTLVSRMTRETGGKRRGDPSQEEGVM